MMTTFLLNLVWSIVSGPLLKVPDLNINYDGLANSTVYQYFQAALYLLPMDTVGAIFAITAVLWILRIVISFLRSLWAALPIL